MALKFEITGDNKSLLHSLEQARDGVRRAAQDIEESGMGIEDMFKRIAGAAGIAFSLGQAQQFASSVMSIRGQFQQLEIAFTTMLQSEEKAHALLNQLVETAATTPFDLRGVAEGAKQLLAYGTAAEDVNETIVRLGDIAAGLSIPLGDLVYLYGTTMVQGRMFTQDLRQFQNRGIPMAEELAKQFGVAKDEVQALVTAGKVGAEQVQQAIWNLTSEGSKFGGLMANQSKSITGQISNIEDAIDEMFNEIGKGSEGLINGGLGAVSGLVENWEKVGQAILAAAEAFGIYKATLMTVSAYNTAATNIGYDAEISALEKLIPLKEQAAASDLESAVASGRLSSSKAEQILVMREEAVAHLQNLKAIAAEDAANAQSAARNLVMAQNRNREAQMSLNYYQRQYDKALELGNALAIEKAEQELNTAASVKNSAAKDLQIAQETELAARTKAVASAKVVETTQNNLETASNAANTASTGILAQAKLTLKKAIDAVNSSFLASPLFWIAAVITGVTFAIHKITSAMSEADKINKSWNDTQKEINANVATERAEIDRLFENLESAREGTDKYKKAKDAILNQYGKYLNGLDEEIATLKNLEGAYKAITLAAREATIERGKEAALRSVQDNYGKIYGENIDKLQEALYNYAGSSKAKEMLDTIQDELRETGTVSKETEELVKELFVGTADYGNSSAWITSLRNNERQLNEYTKRVEQRFKQEEKVEEIQKVRNKAAIEQEKKNLQGELENLTTQEAIGARGAEIKKKIAALDKELQAYSSKSSTTKTSDILKGIDRMQREQAEERVRSEQDLENRVINARIDAMQDGIMKIHALREQQNKEEIQNLERQKADEIKHYIEQEKRLFDEQEKLRKTQNEQYQVKTFDESVVDTSEINAKYEELIALARRKQEREGRMEEIQAMRDYLKEYGSFEQKKLALTQEYEERIAKARTVSEQLSLQKERKKALSQLTYDEISLGIDWKNLFSGIGSISTSMLKPMMDKLQAYTKTDDYRSAEAQTQQAVADLLQELRQYIGSDQSTTWRTLSEAMDEFSRSVDVYNKAVEDEKIALANLENARVRLAKGEIGQDEFDAIETEANRLGDYTVYVKEKMEGSATALNDNSEAVANYTSSLTAVLNRLNAYNRLDGFSSVQQSISDIDSFKGALDSALPEMGEGMAKVLGDNLSSSIGAGLSSLGNGLSGVLSSGLGQMIGFVAQIPQLILEVANAVKNFVKGILDTITELISLRWIDDLVNSILGAIDNLVNAIFDLPENLYKVVESIAVNGIGGLLNTVIGRLGNVLSFGALSSKGPADWFTNSNAEEVANAIEELTDRNKLLTQAIEDLTDEMSKARGSAAIEISSQAAQMQRETIQNYLDIARAQAGYHNAHNSWQYYWQGYDQEQISRLSGQIGRDWNGDIWNLSPEEMKMLRSNVDMWEQIINTGKGGYGESVAEKLNDYIEQAGKLQEITDRLYENLTTTTKENVFNDFLNSLYDLADGSEDVFDNIADEWQQMVNKMVINNLVGARFQKNLEEWYEDLAKLNESKTNGELSDSDYRLRLDKLKAEYEGYVNEAKSEIDALRDSGIIADTGEYRQEATSKGFQTMTQSTAEALEGRFTSLQITGQTISERVLSIFNQMAELTSLQTTGNTYLAEIRNMLLSSNSHLEDISRYTRQMLNDFTARFDQVVSNTSRL